MSPLKVVGHFTFSPAERPAPVNAESHFQEDTALERPAVGASASRFLKQRGWRAGKLLGGRAD